MGTNGNQMKSTFQSLQEAERELNAVAGGVGGNRASVQFARSILAECDQMMSRRSMVEGWLNQMDYPLGLGSADEDHFRLMPFSLSTQVGQVSWQSQFDRELRISRFLYLSNSHYRGIVNTMVNYAVGQEPVVTIKATETTPAAKKLELFARRTWQKLSEEDSSHTPLAMRFREAAVRMLRDGDLFMRQFIQRGAPMAWRFIEPDQIREPENKTHRDRSYTFGIETPRNDVEQILAFWQLPPDRQGVSSADFTRIDASDVIFRKIGTDTTVKRGLPWLYTVRRLIQRYSSWLEDRIILNKVRTAVAMVLKIQGSLPDKQNMALDGLSTGEIDLPDSDGGRKTYKRVKLQPGMLFELGRDEDIEFKSPNIGASDASDDGRAILLAIAVGVNMPEFIVSGDASNANYASTMVAESPGVIALQTMQHILCEPIRAMVRRTVFAEIFGSPTEVPPEAKSVLRITVTGPNVVVRDAQSQANTNKVLFDNKIIDRATWQERAGVDPVEIDRRLEEDDLKPLPGAEGPPARVPFVPGEPKPGDKVATPPSKATAKPKTKESKP